MRINQRLELNTLVVFNHSLEAAMFRAVDVKDRYRIGVVDAHHEGNAIQWVDKSSILVPSIGQLKQYSDECTKTDRATISNAEAVQQLCKDIVSRVEGTELGKGKRAADAALNMFAGAAYIARALGNQGLGEHITKVAVLLIATRGYSEVQLIAANGLG